MTILSRRRRPAMPPGQALTVIADTLRLVVIVAGIGFVFWLLDGLVLELFVVALLSLLLAAIYIAAKPARYMHGAVLLFPPGARAKAAQVMRDCGRALQWWMLGQAIDMMAVAAISTTGLVILGVPLPYALGTLAGLLTFVPYFGAWIGSIPASLVALTVSVHSAVWTVLVFLLCHLVEGYLLAQIVQRRTLDLPPAVTLLSMSVVGAFYGLAGLALATPIAAVVLVAVQEVYVQRLDGGAEVVSGAESG